MEQRTYNCDDASFLEQSRTVRLNFIDNQADFVGLDTAVFSNPFEENWLTEIETSEATETAENRTDQQQQETDEVLDVMKNCRHHYTKLKYYINKAFAGKPKVIDSFGGNDFDLAGYSQKQMQLFMANLTTKCADPVNNAALLAAGCPVALLAQNEALRAQLGAENQEQNQFISKSSEATDLRVKQYNKTDAFWIKVNKASKSIYFDNPIKANYFKRPKGSSVSSDADNLSGTVKASGSPTGEPGVLVKVLELGIDTTTNASGEYGFELPAGSYTIEFSKTGFTTKTEPVNVTATGGITLNVEINPL